MGCICARRAEKARGLGVRSASEVAFDDDAFELLAQTVRDLARGGAVPLSGLKDQVRKRRPGFSEKTYGFASFLSFAKAARARGVVRMAWDESAGDWRLQPA